MLGRIAVIAVMLWCLVPAMAMADQDQDRAMEALDRALGAPAAPPAELPSVPVHTPQSVSPPAAAPATPAPPASPGGKKVEFTEQDCQDMTYTANLEEKSGRIAETADIYMFLFDACPCSKTTERAFDAAVKLYARTKKPLLLAALNRAVFQCNMSPAVAYSMNAKLDKVR